MRSFFVLALAGFLASPVLAQDGGQGVLPPDALPPSLDDFEAPTTEVEPPSGPAPAIAKPEMTGTELDRLFEQLAEAADEDSARPLVARIQRLWLQSGSATVDLLMQRTAAALQAKNYPLALDLADMVVRFAPDYAEGWNRRATVHYLRGDFGAALADIERTLAIEPRHWGAMSGLGMILRRVDRDSEALATFEQVLRLHPQSRNAREAVEELGKKTAGQGI